MRRANVIALRINLISRREKGESKDATTLKTILKISAQLSDSWRPGLEANKEDKNSYSERSFGSFLKSSGIKHIKARLKHPQTNGKVEKWYDLYEKHRLKFENFDNFVNWYNSVRYHESPDPKHYLQTPDDAFCARLPRPAC